MPSCSACSTPPRRRAGAPLLPLLLAGFASAASALRSGACVGHNTNAAAAAAAAPRAPPPLAVAATPPAGWSTSVRVTSAKDYGLDQESLSWYLDNVGRHDLLSIADEQLLSLDVQELLRWQSVRSQLEAEYRRPVTQAEWARAVGFEHVSRIPHLTPLLEGRCFERQLRALSQAKERMINANLRLVVTLAKRYANRGLALQDLIQEGTLGLITAVDKFEPSHMSGAKFSSYASWWIKQRLSRAVGKSGTVRLPARMPALLASIQRARDEYSNTLGREPTNEELASAVGITPQRLKLVLSASRDPVSLDASMRSRRAGWNDNGRTLADVLPHADATPEEALEARMRRQTLARTLAPLLEGVEHQVICSCFNLIEDRSTPLTYGEIGARFGESPEWVEAVEKTALKKLKGRPYLRNLLLSRGLHADSAVH